MNEIYKEYHKVDKFGIHGFFEEYRFLSNFYSAPTMFEGVLYPTSENAFQAAKSPSKGIRNTFQIMTPAEAKKRGKELDLRNDWDDIKYDIMALIVMDKFFRNPHLKEKLLATDGRYLEETNHWGDRIWGVKYDTCEGTNWLGMILMDIRKVYNSSEYAKRKKEIPLG